MPFRLGYYVVLGKLVKKANKYSYVVIGESMSFRLMSFCLMSFCLRHFAYYADWPNAVLTTVVLPNARTRAPTRFRRNEKK